MTLEGLALRSVEHSSYRTIWWDLHVRENLSLASLFWITLEMLRLPLFSLFCMREGRLMLMASRMWARTYSAWALQSRMTTLPLLRISSRRRSGLQQSWVSQLMVLMLKDSREGIGKTGRRPRGVGGCSSYTRRENWLMGVEGPRPRADNIRTVAGKNEDNGGSNVRLHTSQLVLFVSMTFSWYQAGSIPCPYVFRILWSEIHKSNCGELFTVYTPLPSPSSLSLSLVRPLSLYHRVAFSACAVSLRSLSAYNG